MTLEGILQEKHVAMPSGAKHLTNHEHFLGSLDPSVRSG
jgi:hypothetical protein